MMLKAFLAWAGVMAIRAPVQRTVCVCRDHPRNDDVHDEANREMAIFAGTQTAVNRFHRLSDVMDSDPANTTRINRGVNDMRNLMAEVARRADR